MANDLQHYMDATVRQRQRAERAEATIARVRDYCEERIESVKQLDAGDIVAFASAQHILSLLDGDSEGEGP